MKQLIIPMTLMVLLASCAQSRTASQPASAPSSVEIPQLTVAASFYPLAYFAEQVGKGLVAVTQITPGGVEPHDYEPTPSQLASAYQAKVFLMNGEGVDAWGDKIIDDLKAHGVITIRMADTITPMGGFSESGEIDPTHPSSANANAYDPHLWLDPVLAEKEAALIRDAFVRADPAHAGEYQANAAALLGQLASLDREYRQGLAQCKVKDAVVSHNAFRYMAKEYGFTTLAIAGLDPEQEPSPSRVAALADLARREHIRYIFFETLVSPKIAQTVATEIGAQSLVLNPLEGLTKDDEEQGKDYLSIMRDNLQNLRTALQCV